MQPHVTSLFSQAMVEITIASTCATLSPQLICFARLPSFGRFASFQFVHPPHTA
ncbi:hypothetical protein IF1G_09317 [Cordyceps javanica]|uniref:Uncharacterized protein n=1 Tax=Cordyceps javanica TaxID=43265 RepID=A0A545US17_9HYPO|nr:hypothetical protein IF1G_09317 [Cordyceps javanica]